MASQHAGRDALRAIAILWILVSPWVLVHVTAPMILSGAAILNFLIVGVTMIVLSAAPSVTLRSWEGRADAVIGMWLIASPWALRFSENSVLTWNAVIVGALLIGLSRWPRSRPHGRAVRAHSRGPLR